MQNLYTTAEPLGTIPLAEVSGLALGRDDRGAPALLAIGDRAASVAVADLADGVGDLVWRTLDLREAEGSRIPHRDPQLEALAADGARGVLIVQEWPNRAEFVDAATRRVRARIALEVDETAPQQLRRSWRDASCSHAEGVVLLRDGHLLVVKEKDPVALLEFGPAGAVPQGFGPDRWLGLGEQWQIGEGDIALTALAAWEPTASVADSCPDLSDAAIAPNGDLVLVSDQGCAILVIHPAPPTPEPWAGRFDTVASWRIEGLEGKPEGIVVLPEGDILIACDRKKVKGNLYLVGREIWQ